MLHKCSFFFTSFLRQVNISIFILQMKDRKVEQFKQEHFKHLLFLDTSLGTQRLTWRTCSAWFHGFIWSGMYFLSTEQITHSSSQHGRNQRLVQATEQLLSKQTNLSSLVTFPPSFCSQPYVPLPFHQHWHLPDSFCELSLRKGREMCDYFFDNKLQNQFCICNNHRILEWLGLEGTLKII